MEASESSVNAIHPDDPEEDFFGTGAVETTPAADATPEPTPEPEPVPAPEIGAMVAAREAQKAEREAAAAAAPVTAEQVDAAVDAAAAKAAASEPQKAPPTPEEAAAAASAAAAANRGSPEREYVVFQQVPLTEKALTYMLKELKEGTGGNVRVALFELDRVETRNVKLAAGAVYAKHKKVLPEACDLGVVPSKSFQIKHIKPKTRPVETTLEIT